MIILVMTMMMMVVIGDTKALGKLGNNVAETCFLPMFRHVSKSGQTLGNISKKHGETSNVSEFAIGNIFASRETNFVSATMFPRVGKHGNI
jgi:hypothetical protein